MAMVGYMYRTGGIRGKCMTLSKYGTSTVRLVLIHLKLIIVI